MSRIDIALPRRVLVLFLVFSSIHPIKCDMFTSVSTMERMIKGDEMNVVNVVEEYIKEEEYRFEQLRSMAQEYEDDSRRFMKNINSRLFENPVSAYLILKHLAAGWNEIEDVMRENSIEEVITRVSERHSDLKLFIPLQKDIDGAASALLRLQDTYALDTDMLAGGNFPGVGMFGALTAKDCYDIGLVASENDDTYHEILWMEEALKLIKDESPQSSINETLVLPLLANAYYAQDIVPRAIYLTQRWLELEPDDREAREDLRTYQSHLRELESNGTKNGGDFLSIVGNGTIWSSKQLKRNHSFYADAHYEALCRGEKNKPTDRLHCYLKTSPPFLRLAPIKVQVAHENPEILLFKEVVSKEEVERIKSLASPSLTRSEVAIGAKTQAANYRISQNTWLEEHADPIIERLTRRIADMTGLDMQYAELSQIANYGIGGHYEMHHDCGLHYISKEKQGQEIAARYIDGDQKGFDIDDRIATAMFYLAQPVSGGATVFPKIDLTVFPTAGDAVFWYNVHRNGYEDSRVLHAACPVLTGSKWVMNKWISSKNQEFKHPCSSKDE